MKFLILILSFCSSIAFAHNLTTTSWVITDYKGKIIDGENWNEVRPIASIIKLMTVMVVMDAGQDLTEKINGFTRQELIDLAIVHSDNKAVATLCNHYPGGKISCVNAMNAKANKIGLSNTKFVEPTGLSVFNVSTADELVTMVLEASSYQTIVNASKMGQLEIHKKKRKLVFNNTNPITRKNNGIVVSKTGYIRASGGCLVMMFDTEIGRRILIVLNSKNTRTRIADAEFISQKY